MNRGHRPLNGPRDKGKCKTNKMFWKRANRGTAICSVIYGLPEGCMVHGPSYHSNFTYLVAAFRWWRPFSSLPVFVLQMVFSVGKPLWNRVPQSDSEPEPHKRMFVRPLVASWETFNTFMTHVAMVPLFCAFLYILHSYIPIKEHSANVLRTASLS